MYSLLKKIKRLIIDKGVQIILFSFTLIFIFRYIYILQNPLWIDEIKTFPYKTRTELYLAILVILDLIYLMQNKIEKIYNLFFPLSQSIINKLKRILIKVIEIVNKNVFKIVVAVLLFLVVSFFLYKDTIIQLDKADYREKLIPYISICELTEEIIDGTIIEQTFITELDKIDGIYLRTATYMRNNDSNINISLLSMDDELLKEENFSLQNINDNSFTYFRFENPLNVENVKQMKCRITSEGNEVKGNGIALYISSIDNYKNGELIINGIFKEGDCFLELSGNQNDSMLISNLYISICICIILFIGLTGFIILRKENIKLEWLFVFVATIIGGLYLFMIPPYSEHDGEAHFNTIYKYSNKLLGFEVSENQHIIEKDEKDIFGNKFGYPPSKGDYYSISQMVRDNNEYMDQKYEVSELDLNLSDCPIEYISSILGLTIGRILGIKIIYIYYLTRIFNFMVYIILTFFSIKLIPIFKKTLFVIAIFPMALMQAASVSYDATVISTIFLFVSLCLYLIHNKMKKSFLLILAVLIYCLFHNKSGAYFPLVGLILCVPIKNYYNTKQRILFNIITVGIILFIIINNFVDINQSINMTTDIMEHYPITYFIEHPIWFIKILCYTFYTNFELYFKGLFGISIFGIDARTTPLILCLSVSTILLLVKQQESNDMVLYVNNWKRILILICAIGSIFMICFGAISWTKMGMKDISGIQGRYFIPLLFPLMFFKCKSVKIEKAKSNHLLFYMCIINSFYTLFVFTTIWNVGFR